MTRERGAAAMRPPAAGGLGDGSMGAVLHRFQSNPTSGYLNSAEGIVNREGMHPWTTEGELNRCGSRRHFPLPGEAF